jgi:hypothetical protein
MAVGVYEENLSVAVLINCLIALGQFVKIRSLVETTKDCPSVTSAGGQYGRKVTAGKGAVGGWRLRLYWILS